MEITKTHITSQKGVFKFMTIIQSSALCPRYFFKDLYRFGLTTQSSVAVSKKYNHSFRVPKLINVELPSSELKPETFSFKGMRHPLHIVLHALTYYFCGNSTTRKVAQTLHMVRQVKVSHVTVSKWIKYFAHVFKKIADDRILEA